MGNLVFPLFPINRSYLGKDRDEFIQMNVKFTKFPCLSCDSMATWMGKRVVKLRINIKSIFM